ncbi:MAG: QueT transporter family protein [Clostridioides sp.]|jgi:uncharacterized membrane protein|nr:QueT transporter family protein [Clostridioides sp.]
MENIYKKINENDATSSTKKLAVSAIVIALYVVVMALTQSFAFGAVQIRIATALYSLSYFFPFLVLPLGLANVVSNLLFGNLGLLDIIGGGLVGIIAAFLISLIRKKNLNKNFVIPVIIFIPGLVVPIWLSVLLKLPYPPLALSLCLGEVIPAIVGRFMIGTLSNRVLNSGNFK